MMRFQVDPWDPAYGTATDPDEMDGGPDDVQLDTELPIQRWQPIRPRVGELPDAVVFIDGVRRIEARVWVADDHVISGPDPDPVLGVCASWAAGAVRCSFGHAEVVAVDVCRGLFAPSDRLVDVETRHGTYRAIRTASSQPEQLWLAVQGQMAHAERRVTEAAVPAASGVHGSDLVVRDGPLSSESPLAGLALLGPRTSRRRDKLANPADADRATAREPGGDGAGAEGAEGAQPPGLVDGLGVVGMVKTHRVKYLVNGAARVLAALEPGQRTPIFTIAGRFARRTWYVRLPAGAAWSPLSAVVRCETPEHGPIESTIELADLTAYLLVRYASEAHKDPRAPQNLYPIGQLERILRHRLGHAGLAHRALTVASRAAVSIPTA
jgi:hypothetical protein